MAKREVVAVMPIKNRQNDDEKLKSISSDQAVSTSADSPVLGISLLVGFLFMFVVDQLAKRSAKAARLSKSSVPTLGNIANN